MPAEQQAANLQQQIQPHVQLQAQISTISVEQNSKSQPHRPSPQYNPSPEKSRGSLYLLRLLNFIMCLSTFKIQMTTLDRCLDYVFCLLFF